MFTTGQIFAEVAESGLLTRHKRLRMLARKERAWKGIVCALDTEGTRESGKFTASACWNEPDGAVQSPLRFTEPAEFCQFLISLCSRYDGRRKRVPVLFYFHNLEWDLQVLLTWFKQYPDVPLQYKEHTARRNGSALCAKFDYPGRTRGRRRIEFRDSFAIYSQSLAQLGRAVGLPKFRTPKKLIPNMVNWVTGELIPAPDVEDDDAPLCRHGLVECMDCYDLRDVEILHRVMSLYVAECNDAKIAPALTRSAHAMRDFRTNYMSEDYTQFTERENLRAEASRRGGRSEMLHPGLCVAGEKAVIAQADCNSQYPAAMLAGGFPDAQFLEIIQKPPAPLLRRYVGWAWAEVNIRAGISPGPLIYHGPDGRISYPSGQTVFGCWTTEELEYCAELGCELKIWRLEGCAKAHALDPFGAFVQEMWKRRARQKASGDARELSTKLSMNGLSGKFGMRWAEPQLRFRAPDLEQLYVREPFLACIPELAPFEKYEEMPRRYPDYIMTPWSALIMARGRIMLHRFGMRLQELGAKLLCCDTDSWTFYSPHPLPPTLFGSELGEWKLEGQWYAFRGAAPKEYALYADADELWRGEPQKARAKGLGVGGDISGRRAIDHYLRTGDVYYSVAGKSRSILHGVAKAASFATIHKQRHGRIAPVIAPVPADVRTVIAQEIAEAHSKTLWQRRQNFTPTVIGPWNFLESKKKAS